jgi:hypothetical protein
LASGIQAHEETNKKERFDQKFDLLLVFKEREAGMWVPAAIITMKHCWPLSNKSEKAAMPSRKVCQKMISPPSSNLKRSGLISKRPPKVCKQELHWLLEWMDPEEWAKTQRVDIPSNRVATAGEGVTIHTTQVDKATVALAFHLDGCLKCLVDTFPFVPHV